MNKDINYSIFFAASPMHLMCIYELHKKKPERKFQLIIFLKKNDYANSQLYKTLDLLGFNKFIIFKMYENNILNYFPLLLLAAKLYKSFNYLNLNIVMIDFQNSFMHLLRCVFKGATFTLIDDRFNTCVAYEKYLKNKIYLPVDNFKSIRGTLARLIYFGTDYNNLKNKKIELFSLYLESFNPNRVTGSRNYLSSIKDKLGTTFPRQNKDNVFFIGTNNSESGAMSLADELFYIEWLNNYWKKKGKNLFYIAKISSSDSKISLIKKLNIKVLKFNLPLELALMNNDFIPGSICDTGSALLKTLPILYSSIEYYFVDVTSFYIYKANKDIFDISKLFCSKQVKRTIVIIR